LSSTGRAEKKTKKRGGKEEKGEEIGK